MVADDKDHGLTGVHVDTLVTLVVSRMMVDAVSSPVAGNAAALGDHIGIAAAGDRVKIYIAVVADVFETRFLDDNVVECHLLAGHSIALGLAVEVFVILVILFIVDQAGLRDREGALADVGYYALSAGVTENAKDIFGFESAYLQSVASPFDRSAPSYCTVVRVACDDMVKALDGQDKASVHQISQIQRTQAGSVLSLTIGEQTYTGMELRERLGLRSAHFTIEDKGDYFVFTVLGYGHGVGMSQYGANEMARQGADYREILAHYYQGAVISQ